MALKILLPLVLYCVFISCTRSTDSESDPITADSLTTEGDSAEADYEKFRRLGSYLTSSAPGDSTLQTVDKDCAIFIYPTGQQADDMLKEYGEDDFNTIADDMGFYQSQAMGMLDSVGVRQIDAKGQYLRLVGETKTWDLDLRQNGAPAWNLIYFKRNKEPKIVAPIEVTVEQLKEYFESDN